MSVCSVAAAVSLSHAALGDFQLVVVQERSLLWKLSDLTPVPWQILSAGLCDISKLLIGPEHAKGLRYRHR
jgi:hypothetical protein